MKFLRRVLIALVGGSVLLVGIALIVLPGPAVLVIPAGLAILAIEFTWAKRWLDKVRQYMPGKKNMPVDEQIATKSVTQETKP